MSFSSFGASTGHSGSALRFGLVDIKPIEIVETIKRFGIKFRRTSRTLENLKPSQSYADYVTFENEAIFAKIDVPDWFETKKLINLYSKKEIMSYEKDTELKQAVEQARKSRKTGRPLLSFTQFIIRRYESYREEYLEAEATRFLLSNFPLSFYNKFVVFDNTFYDFLKILEHTVRFHEFRASTGRSFEVYRRHIEAMKKSLNPILDQMDTCIFLASCLKRYVTLWNAESYDKLSRVEFWDIGKIDYSKFERLNNEFRMKLTETREFLLRHDPKFLQKELNLEDNPTARMFGKLIMLPSSSLAVG